MLVDCKRINSVLCASRKSRQGKLFYILLIFLQVTLSFTVHNDSAFVEFKPHIILLGENDYFNVSCIVTGSSENDNNITLKFYLEGEDILGPNPFENKIIDVDSYNKSFNLSIHPLSIGHSVLYAKSDTESANMTDTTNAFVRIYVHYSKNLDFLSDIVGWTYFLAWSISFYPQIFLNWRRKSVIGLHFDFLALNLIGFVMYSIFNIGLYWISAIEEEYLKRHLYGVIPVQLNDVIFSLHAIFACTILIIQCIIYERGDQKVSKTGRSIISGIIIIAIITAILGAVHSIKWLDYLYILSYLKLFITLIKYIPQAYYNYLRKSTSGWSIGNILLDFSGGALSILQMLIIASNYNDWSSIFGDPTKFGLGLFSIIFDIFFIIQHYVLYNNFETYEVLQEESSIQSRERSPEQIVREINNGSTRVTIE